MFVLFVDMSVKSGSHPDLEKTYSEIFRPAISRQEGFRCCVPTRTVANIGCASLSRFMLCRKNGWQAIFINKYGPKSKAIVRATPSRTTPRFNRIFYYDAPLSTSPSGFS